MTLPDTAADHGREHDPRPRHDRDGDPGFRDAPVPRPTTIAEGVFAIVSGLAVVVLCGFALLMFALSQMDW